MNGPTLAAAVLLWSATTVVVAASGAQDELTGGVAALERSPTTLSDADRDALLRSFERALESKDAVELAAVVEKIVPHDNPEFLPLVLDALTYSATTFDKKTAKATAKELDTDAQDVWTLRESTVQEAAALALANHPGKKTSAALAKIYKDKSVRKAKPAVTAAAIWALGRLGDTKLEKDIAKDLTRAPDPAVASASARYFGQVKTKKAAFALDLADLLDAPPQSGDINNIEMERAERERWSRMSADVIWSLQQITGQTFRAANAGEPSERSKARDYIKKNKRELGLK